MEATCALHPALRGTATQLLHVRLVEGVKLAAQQVQGVPKFLETRYQDKNQQDQNQNDGMQSCRTAEEVHIESCIPQTHAPVVVTGS